LFIAGLKRMERERGSGWLDCPNCHEHALQDVVDAMRFLSVGFFRVTPVERTRFLICRRCGYRREATPEELAALETMGRPLRRAWFVPFGGLSLLLVAVIVYVGFASPTSGSTVAGITFVNTNLGQLLPATADLPQNWMVTYFTKPDDQPPPRVEVTTTSTGTEKIVLAKFSDSSTLAEVILNHFADQTSLQVASFPSVPPQADCTKIGDATAAKATVDYKSAGAKAEIIMYAFIKSGIAYGLTFVGVGADNITTMQGVALHVAASFKVVASPSASASAAAGATPSPSPSPSASPSGSGPTASPSPAYLVTCH
jgi:hypothetical protein